MITVTNLKYINNSSTLLKFIEKDFVPINEWCNEYIVFVKEYEFNKPLIQKIDSIIDISIRNCHNK